LLKRVKGLWVARVPDPPCLVSLPGPILLWSAAGRSPSLTLPDPMLTLRIARGRCLPLGASAQPDGVNFALLCRHGTAVFLVLYTLDAQKPIAEVALHPRRNRTGDHWHVLVAGLPPAFNYGWRVDGPPG